MNTVTSVLAWTVAVLSLLFLAREIHRKKRQRLGVLILLVAAVGLTIYAYRRVSHGWAIALLAVLAVGLYRMWRVKKLWWLLLPIGAFAALVSAFATPAMAIYANSHGVCVDSHNKPVSGYVSKHTPDGKPVMSHGKVLCAKPEPTSTTTSTSSSTTTSTTVPFRAPTTCPSGRRVKMDPNLEGRFLSKGVKATTVPGFRKEIHDWVKTDPKALAWYYDGSPLGQLTPIKTVGELVQGGIVADGNCFSKEGIAKFSEWEPLWKTAGITPVSSMPPGWSNSGVSNGQPHSGPPPTGNTSGWMVSYKGPTGKTTGQTGVMKRCGNPVTPHPLAPVPSTPPPTPGKQLKNCPPKDPDPQHPPTCGTNGSGPEQQPVQENKQHHRPGYNPGNKENIEAVQPVGSPDPRRPIPPTPKGSNSGSTTGGPRGGDTTTGQVQGPTQGQSGGTHGTNTGTQGSNQTNTGTVPPF